MPQSPIILGIETSCDDTAAAVVKRSKVLSNCVASQPVHATYGGVVPELASRAHQQIIHGVVTQALQQAQITLNDIDGIAYTHGPGLMGSLLVGCSFARGLSLALNKPCIAVHHMEAHMQSLLIKENSDGSLNEVPEFPFLCLTVSGGHSQLVLVEQAHRFKILGETLDDAAGEAFDKVSKILGLPYPGGPLIDAYAARGNARAFSFPIARVPDLNFSFSGFKTSFLYFYQKFNPTQRALTESERCDLCASAQFAIVEELMLKFRKALSLHPVKHIAIAGGVSANSGLRKRLQELAQQKGLSLFMPRMEYCTDNAAMVALSGVLNAKNQQRIHRIDAPLPRWEIALT
jgi:N6-L-threonylcarbamoyladenine synthase